MSKTRKARNRKVAGIKASGYQCSKLPGELLVIQGPSNEGMVYVVRVTKEEPLSFKMEDRGKCFALGDFILKEQFSHEIQIYGFNELVGRMKRRKIKVRCDLEILMD